MPQTGGKHTGGCLPNPGNGVRFGNLHLLAEALREANEHERGIVTICRRLSQAATPSPPLFTLAILKGGATAL